VFKYLLEIRSIAIVFLKQMLVIFSKEKLFFNKPFKTDLLGGCRLLND